MNAIVQNTSAKIARQSDSLLPIPITLGNELESIENPTSSVTILFEEESLREERRILEEEYLRWHPE